MNLDEKSQAEKRMNDLEMRVRATEIEVSKLDNIVKQTAMLTRVLAQTMLKRIDIVDARVPPPGNAQWN